LQFSSDFAINLTLQELKLIPNYAGPEAYSLYAIAVYNCAGDILVNYAQDLPDNDPSDYWANLRQTLGVNTFMPGFITSAFDQGTQESSKVIAQLANATIANLQQAKTPWGRQYLAIAGQWGTLWGIS
jgi:hypothetical protein